jgi:hypothetical protein
VAFAIGCTPLIFLGDLILSFQDSELSCSAMATFGTGAIWPID